MILRSDLLAAFCVALGVHVLALGWTSLPEGGGAGNGGDASLSVAPASAAIAAMVQDWDKMPDIHAAGPVMAVETFETEMVDRPDAESIVARAKAPVLQAEPENARPVEVVNAPAPMKVVDALVQDIALATLAPGVGDPKATTPSALAVLPTPSPVFEAPDAPAAPDRAVVESARPPARPVRTARATSEAVAKRVASGIGAGTVRGEAAPKAKSGPSAAAVASAQSQWAVSIQSRIARHQSYPRGTRGKGRVRLAMVVLPSGTLSKVSIARSSGNAAFDKAAVKAAQKAAPFPAAPKTLTEASYAFAQWVTFDR